MFLHIIGDLGLSLAVLAALFLLLDRKRSWGSTAFETFLIASGILLYVILSQ